MLDVGCDPHHCGESVKCIAPTVEVGDRSAKRGENRVSPDPNGAFPGAEQLRVDHERTPEPSSSLTGESGVPRAGATARPRRPKRERLWGPADLLPTGHSPISNPADSATLRLPSTSIRNVVTPLGSPRVARGAGTALPQARGRVRWPKQPRPGVMPGIRRRGPRWSEGSGSSRSTHVMSPAATLGYEWQPLPSRKREQSVCKLPKRSFQAARRPKTCRQRRPYGQRRRSPRRPHPRRRPMLRRPRLEGSLR